MKNNSSESIKKQGARGRVQCGFVALKQFLICASAALSALAASADTLTWIGRGDAPVFSDALNWKSDGSHVVPQNGDTISFSGIGAAISVSNDIANLRVADIQNASAKVVTIDGTLVADTIGTNNHSRYIAAGENGDITVDTIDFSGSGAAMVNSSRGVFRIGTGRLVSTAASNQNAYLTDNAESTMPIVVTNGLIDKVDHSNGHNFYLNGNARDTEIILGPGGLSFEGTVGYVFQVYAGRNVTIHPMADWSLAQGLFANGDLSVSFITPARSPSPVTARSSSIARIAPTTPIVRSISRTLRPFR